MFLIYSNFFRWFIILKIKKFSSITLWTNAISSLVISSISSIEDFLEQGNEVKASVNRSYSRIEPEKAIEDQELKEKITEALDLLTEKEKKVVLLYYYEDLTLKEISRIMDVSESRVSQLHSKALKKLC